MEKFLIVNADDFGHCKGISKGICTAHENGIVTSTTAMMNRPGAYQDVLNAQREFPSLGFGIHLVLIAGKSVLPSERIPTLVDTESTFHGQSNLLNHLDQINLEEVRAEWGAQINRFCATGKQPDHLDAHHHCAYQSPKLFEILLDFADELHCPIRIPFGEALTIEFENQFRDLISLRKPQFPQVFFGDFYDQGATIDHLSEIVTMIQEDDQHSTFEIMCHPAVVDAELHEISDYHDMRGQELEILQKNEIREKILQAGIHLISFSDLQEKSLS